MKPDRGRDIREGFLGALDSLARTVLYVGLAAFAIGTGFLILSYFGSGSQPEAAIDANINRFMPIAMLGAIAVAVAGSWIMLEEETAGVITAIVGGLLMFAPSVFPQMGGPTGDVSARVLNAISQVGIPILVGGVFLILYDMGSRIRTRAREGARADKLKLGQGLKEERDYQNVFLGKCWQLPYCRKFIREHCPIYHAKTTCWKERVGCMCEEAIIGNAMKGKNEEPQDPDLVASGKVVATGPKLTKEQLLSGKYIPQNNRLTPKQKLERCRQCVIYNEHLKHQFKVAMPVWMIVVAAVYLLMREPLAQGMKNLLLGAERSVRSATFDASRTSALDGSIPFHEIALLAVVIMVFAYGVRFIEFTFFSHRN
ncbi:MAG: hypothetical protein Fur0036_13470 [Fimbriimonadaceae bacterium]